MHQYLPSSDELKDVRVRAGDYRNQSLNHVNPLHVRSNSSLMAFRLIQLLMNSPFFKHYTYFEFTNFGSFFISVEKLSVFSQALVPVTETFEDYNSIFMVDGNSLSTEIESSVTGCFFPNFFYNDFLIWTQTRCKTHFK